MLPAPLKAKANFLIGSMIFKWMLKQNGLCWGTLISLEKQKTEIDLEETLGTCSDLMLQSVTWELMKFIYRAGNLHGQICNQLHYFRSLIGSSLLVVGPSLTPPLLLLHWIWLPLIIVLLLCTSQLLSQKPAFSGLQNHWLRHSDYLNVLSQSWGVQQNQNDNAKLLTSKLKNLRKDLKDW